MSDEIPDSLSEEGSEFVLSMRPDVPEFWKLSELLLSMDTEVNEHPERFAEIVERFIPVKVIAYVSMQRTFITIKNSGLPLASEVMVVVQIKDIIAIASATWIDGFIAGANYQKKYGRPDE